AGDEVRHVVLLGDSVFDNGAYVPGEPPVIEQLREALQPGWAASLLAVDGHVTADVATQLQELPPNASHLIVSCGGNDVLGESPILRAPAATVGDALERLYETGRRFRDRYRKMRKAVAATGKPFAVCSIYDAIPGLGPAEQSAL